MNQKKSTLPKWLTYTLIGVGTTLVISAILNILTPKEEIIPTTLITTNYDQTSSEFSNLVYTGSPINVPARLNIAQATISSYGQELKSNLIKQFSLTQIQNFNVWTSEEWALTMEEGESSRFILSNQNISQDSNGTIALNQATSTAQKFLDKYFPQYQVTLLSDQTEYSDGQYEDPVKTNIDKAQIIKVAFGYAINGYPVFYKNNINNFIEVYVDASEKIRKVSFSAYDISLKNIDTKSTFSPEIALQLANQTNQAAIVNTGYQSPVKLDFSNITSGKFDSVTIEYRVDPEQNLVYPFYRFVGFITDSKKQSFSAELITPAIEIAPTR